jgi:hypothetical protein
MQPFVTRSPFATRLTTEEIVALLDFGGEAFTTLPEHRDRDSPIELGFETPPDFVRRAHALGVLCDEPRVFARRLNDPDYTLELLDSDGQVIAQGLR